MTEILLVMERQGLSFRRWYDAFRPDARIAKTLERLHWKLWDGDIHGARQAMTRVLKLLEPFDIGRTRAQTVLAANPLRTAMTKPRDYIEGQSVHLVNYGLRHPQGKPIGTSTTEGLANTLVNQRMNKLQQMRSHGSGQRPKLWQS